MKAVGGIGFRGKSCSGNGLFWESCVCVRACMIPHIIFLLEGQCGGE